MILTKAKQKVNAYDIQLDHVTENEIGVIETDPYFSLDKVYCRPCELFTINLTYNVGSNLLTTIQCPLWETLGYYEQGYEPWEPIIKSYPITVPGVRASLDSIEKYNCEKGVPDLYEAQVLGLPLQVLEKIQISGVILKEFEFKLDFEEPKSDVFTSSVTMRFKADSYTSALRRILPFIRDYNRENML